MQKFKQVICKPKDTLDHAYSLHPTLYSNLELIMLTIELQRGFCIYLNGSC